MDDAAVAPPSSTAEDAAPTALPPSAFVTPGVTQPAARHSPTQEQSHDVNERAAEGSRTREGEAVTPVGVPGAKERVTAGDGANDEEGIPLCSL